MVSEVTWERVQKALDYDVHASDIESIKQCIESGAYQLWESENSSMVTHGINLASGGVGVNVVAAAGDLQEIVGLLTQVEQEARASGVELLTTTGRNGWKPTARLLGWDHVASIYTKRLD
jgi:hypothetical protein